MKLLVWLKLGRVSNLPTVWSNVLAALALSGALSRHLSVLSLAAIFSGFYVAGMFLNDAFDRHVDARERPARPIPSGQVSAASVFSAGFGLLTAAVVSTTLVASGGSASPPLAVASGFVLAALIVIYDAFHKQNPLSPLIMGACRVMVYVTAALCVTRSLEPPLLLGAGALWCHLIGLTYAAKQEAFNRLTRLWPLAFLAVPVLLGCWLALGEPLVWGFVGAHAAWLIASLRFLRAGPERSVPAAVVRLIAGIALLDALLVASTAQLGWALLCASLCPLTRLFQRYVPGT